MNYSTRIRFASDPKTSPEILDQLTNMSGADYCGLRYQIAKNKNTSSATLHKLSYDNDYWTRRKVAANPNTSIETLDRLSSDDEWWVRYHVSGNPTTPNYLIKYINYSLL
jgi:hypothetical protein